MVPIGRSISICAWPPSSSVRLLLLYHGCLAHGIVVSVSVMATHLVEGGGNGVQDPSTHLMNTLPVTRYQNAGTYVEAIANANVPHGKSQVSSPVVTFPDTLFSPVTSLSA